MITHDGEWLVLTEIGYSVIAEVVKRMVRFPHLRSFTKPFGELKEYPYTETEEHPNNFSFLS